MQIMKFYKKWSYQTIMYLLNNITTNAIEQSKL